MIALVMIVCLCHRVSDRDIARAAAAGCASFAALQAELGVGTGCGCCIEFAHDAFREHSGRCGSDCAACEHGQAAVGEGVTA